VLAHLSPFDADTGNNLVRAAGFCRSQTYHEAEGSYPAQFARHRGRAIRGCSASLHYLLRESRNACAKQERYTDEDLAFSNVSLDAKGATPMS
jgi:hypothetical protein